jgi:hypothetical protein
MSSISGDFLPYLPPQTVPLDPRPQATPAPATSDTPLDTSDPAGTDETPTTAPETEPAVTGPRGHAYGYQHGYGVMFRKLATVVGSALEAAQANPAFDPNQVLEETMAQFFADNNVQPPSRRAERSHRAPEPEPAPQPEPQPAPEPSPEPDPEALAAQTPSQPGLAPSPAYQSFMQMLRSYGIDPQQFRKDFFAALRQARAGTVDPGTALQSFPPGTTIDAAT